MRLLLALPLLALLASGPAFAQVVPPPETPGERMEEIPLPPPRTEAEGPLLAPAPEALPRTALPELKVEVQRIAIDGNTVLPEERLEAVAGRYAGRALTTEEIEALRRELTLLYVEEGYVTSGAVIPDQGFAEGTLRVVIVEGRVGELRLSGQERFREVYLRDRILPDPGAPLDVVALEERLQTLQQSPQIAAVHAELRPGLVLGESSLRVRVVESRPYSLAFASANDRSPVIGEINFSARAGLDNVVGLGDRLEARGEFGESLRDVLARYTLPVGRYGTRLDLRFRWSESEIVEEPFDALDIESDYLAGGVALVQPLWTTPRDSVNVGLAAEWRRSRNWLGGFRFSFAEGAERGVSQVAPLRPFVEWVRRDERQVIALRGQVSIGLPVLGATDRPGALADGTFVAGLLQAQWARRFDRLLGTEVIVRADLQLASDPLLAIEQFSVGGHASVRGYRENQLVADNGFAASFETRIPLWRRPEGTPILQLVPFVDVGRAWDHESRPGSRGKTLASAGVGLRVRPLRWLFGELYWGGRIVDVPNPHDSLADEGIYFRVDATVF